MRTGTPESQVVIIPGVGPETTCCLNSATSKDDLAHLVARRQHGHGCEQRRSVLTQHDATS